ncbi:MAG TPA: ChbG/HpnK family deacetylase [Bacteroidales bacterium]|nr:ChbG/HpnK family deacetylase [Bacteroidales bacterium]
MTDKRLIINADDFGWDEAATAGIAHLLEKGKISSTTILANFATENDLEKVRSIDGISTGLHINLINGKPVSRPEEVDTLLDAEGKFLGAGKLYKRFLMRRINKDHIVKEVAAQIKSLRENGIDISHADSHQHLHQFPGLGKWILQAVADNGIKKVRNCRLTRIHAGRSVVIALFAATTSRNLKPFQHPDALIAELSFGSDYSDDFANQLLSSHFRKGDVFEIMTHPATADKTDSYLHRKAEFDFWDTLPLKEILSGNKINMINYREL